MSIPFTTIINADGYWVYTWGTGLGVVRIVLWGVLLATTDENTYTYTSAFFNNDDTIAPPLEVVPDGELALSEQNICFLVLQWYREECEHYDIEYYKSGDWVKWASVPDSSDVFIFSAVTPVLEDMVEARWRITPVDTTKRTGAPLEFRHMMVRPPDVPTALPELSCAGGTLTIE